nr:lysis system i-spanin subunit Rz [Sodalis glossinidius]
MQTISALDTQHTKALEHDKKLITQLERDVATGRRRLHVKATCSNVSANATSSSLDDAARARLTTPLNEIISPSDGESKLRKSR